MFQRRQFSNWAARAYGPSVNVTNSLFNNVSSATDEDFVFNKDAHVFTTGTQARKKSEWALFEKFVRRTFNIDVNTEKFNVELITAFGLWMAQESYASQTVRNTISTVFNMAVYKRCLKDAAFSQTLKEQCYRDVMTRLNQVFTSCCNFCE